ncbi:MAG: hypothetical protein WKG06_21720 [Segetibacter sp.]
MAKNGKAVSNGSGNWAVKGKTQVYNPATGHYIKRNSATGKFVDVKSDGTAFKGVTKETRRTNIGFSISKVVANKAEAAVIKTLNKKVK